MSDRKYSHPWAEKKYGYQPDPEVIQADLRNQWLPSMPSAKAGSNVGRGKGRRGGYDRTPFKGRKETTDYKTFQSVAQHVVWENDAFSMVVPEGDKHGGDFGTVLMDRKDEKGEPIPPTPIWEICERVIEKCPGAWGDFRTKWGENAHHKLFCFVIYRLNNYHPARGVCIAILQDRADRAAGRAPTLRRGSSARARATRRKSPPPAPVAPAAGTAPVSTVAPKPGAAAAGSAAIAPAAPVASLVASSVASSSMQGLESSAADQQLRAASEAKDADNPHNQAVRMNGQVAPRRGVNIARKTESKGKTPKAAKSAKKHKDTEKAAADSTDEYDSNGELSAAAVEKKKKRKRTERPVKQLKKAKAAKKETPTTTRKRGRAAPIVSDDSEESSAEETGEGETSAEESDGRDPTSGDDSA